MYLLGITLSMITMFGLLIVLGIDLAVARIRQASKKVLVGP